MGVKPNRKQFYQYQSSTFGDGGTSFSSSSSKETIAKEESYDEESKGSLVVSDQGSESEGSSVLGAALNFTNSIVGAGCIGYGGAVADSGGLVSVLAITVFAFLTKVSYDLLIDLGIEYQISSYEALGTKAFGSVGRLAVIWSKAVFGFGGMVAFMVVVRDNFSPACLALVESHEMDGNGIATFLLGSDTWTTVFLCSSVMLPLSLLRNVTFLERFSSAKIVIFGGIVVTVIYFFFALPPSDDSSSLSFREKWLEVRPGVVKSTGTFIYGFVAQHTVHMVFRSLQRSKRNIDDWMEVSTIAIGLSYSIFISLGIFAYMTFWTATSSDLFRQYPSNHLVNCAQILLSIAMLFTYPMNLLSVRELCVPALLRELEQTDDSRSTKGDKLASDFPSETDGLLDGIVAIDASDDDTTHEEPDSTIALGWVQHAALTLVLWATSLLVAVSGASLGDVLNLIGCVAGALIAFILPALFAFHLRGYTHLSALLMASGCFIGFFGTYFGLRDLLV